MKLPFMLSLLLLSSSLFAGAFLDEMMQIYLPGGQMPQEKIDYLNSKTGKIPSAISSFMNKQEKVNIIITTKEGEKVRIRAVAYKNGGGAPQLESAVLGEHKSPTIIIYADEKTAQGIYNAKDEEREMRKAVANGEIKVEFPGDFVRSFLWAVTSAFTGVINAFV